MLIGMAVSTAPHCLPDAPHPGPDLRLASLASLPSCEQVFKIDDHLGIAISGLTADGRILCRYMRNECLNHR